MHVKPWVSHGSWPIRNYLALALLSIIIYFGSVGWGMIISWYLRSRAIFLYNVLIRITYRTLLIFSVCFEKGSNQLFVTQYMYTIYLSLCTQTADPNPFRGTHGISRIECRDGTADRYKIVNSTVPGAVFVSVEADNALSQSSTKHWLPNKYRGF